MLNCHTVSPNIHPNNGLKWLINGINNLFYYIHFFIILLYYFISFTNLILLLLFLILIYSITKNVERFTILRVIFAQGPC